VIHSEVFAQLARHPEHPRAFTRQRVLTLPALVTSLLCLRGSPVPTMLEDFFSRLRGSASGLQGVTDRAFAKARSHLHVPALTALNDDVVERADAAGLVQRWRGFRLVAADASVFMPAIRRCARTRGLASADQRLFALYLPGPELTLHAALHSASESERAMLAHALDRLGPDDVLLLDRGYPAAWLINLLTQRGVRFVMRCDQRSGGWTGLQHFMRSSVPEAQVRLRAPTARDAADWQCPASAPEVRLVRQLAPNGQTRVLMTNLSAEQAPADSFGWLYHQRWRIEEAFKRLKLRLHLEAVSGLSQHAVMVDVAAKVLADNLASLVAMAAQQHAHAPPDRPCNRAHAVHGLQRILPRLLVDLCAAFELLDCLITRLSRSLKRRKPERSAPRPPSKSKPHPSLAYRG
jgi:hypothetical protein